MNVGNWDIKVSFDSMPQPVASGLAAVREKMVGAEYDMIAYLGSQEVNGTNYAVLATQVLTTGRDSQNIVILKFNQKPGEIVATLTGVEHILDAGAPLGGIVVDPKTEIPTDAQKIWLDVTEGYVGKKLTPIAYLGTQMANGMNYFFIVEATGITREDDKEILLTVINPTVGSCKIVNVLESRATNALGYAFSW